MNTEPMRYELGRRRDDLQVQTTVQRNGVALRAYETYCTKDLAYFAISKLDAWNENPARCLNGPAREVKETREPYLLLILEDVLCEHLALVDAYFSNVVVLQSTLHSLRETNFGRYTRIVKMIDEERILLVPDVFDYELHTPYSMDSYAQVRTEAATKWLLQHGSVVVLTQTALDYEGEPRTKRQSTLENLQFFDLLGYISTLPIKDELLEFIRTHADYEYEEYVDDSALELLLSEGKAFRGTLVVNQNNCFYGSVLVNYGGGRSVKIGGRRNMNRALHNDTVAVALIEEEGTSDLEALSGKVIAVLNNRSVLVCCTLNEENHQKTILATPIDRKYPKIRVATQNEAFLLNSIFVVKMGAWDARSKHPVGNYVRRIGMSGDENTEVRAVLLENNIVYERFSAFTQEQTKELPSDDWEIPVEETKTRLDLRNERVMSIDPPGCTDIDDALHIKTLCAKEDGLLYEVGVHIADVSYYLNKDTPLDLEAQHRGNTFYLPKERLDMLPSVLSSNLCSLVEGRDRLSFSVVWKIDSSGVIHETRFVKSIIRSRRAFTYEEAHNALPTSKELQALYQISRCLNRKRIEAGALVLSTKQETVFVGEELKTKSVYEVNSMVEEFMLLANTSVAERIYASFPDSSILRRHPSPSAEALRLLSERLADVGVEFRWETPKEINESLERLPGKYAEIIRTMTIRSMMQATYVSSGDHPYEGFFHYGLATPIYLHFTSPIRRYADVVAHRQLYAAINDQANPYSGRELRDLCSGLNERHTAAQRIVFSLNDYYRYVRFRSLVKDGFVEEEGVVVKQLSKSIAVFLKTSRFEGVAEVASPEDYRLFDEVRVRITINEKEGSYKRKVVITLV